MTEKKCTCGDTESQHYENMDKCVVCGCKEFEDIDPVIGTDTADGVRCEVRGHKEADTIVVTDVSFTNPELERKVEAIEFRVKVVPEVAQHMVNVAGELNTTLLLKAKDIEGLSTALTEAYEAGRKEGEQNGTERKGDKVGGR
jgi:hypothetical protein